MSDEPQPIHVLEYRTPPPPSRLPFIPSRPILESLNWAGFLGASWTWCIGMFLPVLLMRDYGATMWWIFAVPNVLGAAAMGWILRGDDDSATMEHAHRPAAMTFSAVTIAFHIFFAAWLIRSLWGAFALPLLLTISIAVFIMLRVWRSMDRFLAWVALSASMLLIAPLFGSYEMGNPGPRDLFTREAFGLVCLALICSFGFTLCPYLDLTFHRARRAVDPTGAKLAFGLGFGVFFFAMIYLTAAYVVPMRYVLKDGYFNGPQAVIAAIAAHLLIQTALTVSLHARELADRYQRIPLIVWTVIAIAIIASAVAGALINNQDRWYRLNPGEVVYRIFMGFYGLVFPAYVWLCMIPGSGRMKPTHRQLTVFAVAVLIAAPMFWFGFVKQQLIWLLPGLAVVLLARAAIPARDPAKA